MTEKVAIVGSREGADLEYLADVFLPALREKYPDTIIVSGGADGVDRVAEQKWLELGGQVISLRPVQVDATTWGVERWELGGTHPRMFRLVNEPTMADFKSAALARDLLIAEECDRLVAFFRPGGSRGAGFTAEMAGHWGRPVHEYTGEVIAP